MLHAVIMAGGSGTRFWPASRKLVPKQLLPLAGDRTMLQSTVDRLGDLIAPSRLLILTNKILAESVRSQLPAIPADNVVGEPCKRDTAPCIGLAAALVHHADPEGTMVVMPSDHVIASPDKFQAAISAGQKLVDEDPTRIVTFGIPPSYPAESFGYVQRGESIEADGVAAYQVKKFREKPDAATAKDYVAAGTYYWNSGIFLWRAATILDALKSNVPEMRQHIANIAAAIGSDSYDATLETEFAAIKGTSIDYAVMEDYPNVVMVEAPFPLGRRRQLASAVTSALARSRWEYRCRFAHRDRYQRFDHPRPEWAHDCHHRCGGSDHCANAGCDAGRTQTR